MIYRNKGDTEDFENSILIPRNKASQFKESILRILESVELHKSMKVQQSDIKHIYQLLEYFSDKE